MHFIEDDDEQPQNKLTRADYDKINEAIIRKNPNLGLIDERIIYDKEFLLEVQAKGYNPLDKEDVKNYLEGKFPKNLDRNLKLCGADRYKSLGQSEFEEDDLQKFLGKKELKPVVKKAEDIYLSDIPAKKAKEYLIETSTEDANKKINELNKENDIYGDYKNFDLKNEPHKESEDEFRKNLAKAFGVDEMKIKKSDYISNSKEIVRKDEKTDKLLELIKELRTLGFSPEEIKKEIQRFH